MINGFEDITKPLSDDELRTVYPRAVDILRAARGRERAITNKDIVSRLQAEGIKTSGPRIRAVIHHARVTGEVKLLVGTSDGYYIASSSQELDDYIDSLDSRIMAIRIVRNALHKQWAESETTSDLFSGVCRG